MTVPRDTFDHAPLETVTVLLFPGAYRLYPGLADRVTIEPAYLLALPRKESRPPVAITGELTQRGVDVARQTFDDHLDNNCVRQTVVSPEGCPFSAGTQGGVTLPEATIDDDSFTDVRDVSWRITAYPEVTFEPGAGDFTAVLREQGTIRLSGSGLPRKGDEAGRVGFTADCGVHLRNLRLVPAQTGFTVVPGDVLGVEFSDARCRRPVS